MKAVVLTENGVVLDEIIKTPPPKQWAQVCVTHAGLCGTDVSKISGPSLPPSHTRILGHELVGELAELNGSAADLSLGGKVVVMPLVACGKCRACEQGQENLCTEAQAIGRTLPGAFAQFVNVPLANIVRIPSTYDTDTYVLADTLAVCLHAVKLGTASAVDQRCLVVGDGSIGCLTAWLLRRQRRAVWIKGVHEENVRFAEAMGVKRLTSEAEADPFDVVYETVGRSQSETLNECLRLVRPAGRVVVLGVFAPGYTYPLLARGLFIKEVRLQGSNAYVLAEFKEAVDLISTARSELVGFISHHFPLARFEEALMAARHKSGFTMKIVLDIGGLSL